MQKPLILRGEEKQSAEDLETALHELISKLDEWSPMFYGKCDAWTIIVFLHRPSQEVHGLGSWQLGYAITQQLSLCLH